MSLQYSVTTISRIAPQESEVHFLQRLKESAQKLTADQLSVRDCQIPRETTRSIEMQREAADMFRRSVNSEYLAHFEL